jgi:hypothetical protein
LSEINDFIHNLYSCSEGQEGWKDFEDICIDILCYLFVPPLNKPRIQPRTLSGTTRRDAVFPVRKSSIDQNRSWKDLIEGFNNRMLLVEFKNNKKTNITPEEVGQLFIYMSPPMGNLALMICNIKPKPRAHAYIKRNSLYSEYKKVILFLDKSDLREMLFIKERGENPADLLLDQIDAFYVQHE